MKPAIIKVPSKAEWVSKTTQQIITSAKSALKNRGEFSLVLSGGGTPKPIYQQLATMPEQIDWQHTFIFWGDERCVPPDHRESNYRMAKKALLDHLPVPEQNVFRMLGEIDPVAAAQEYKEMLMAFFHNKEKRFDLVLLGIGEDGHTASLFPEADVLEERVEWVSATNHPYTESNRLTLTYPALNAARQIIFLASGGSKADVIADVINNPEKLPAYPAKGITGLDTPPLWILDTEAAAKL